MLLAITSEIQHFAIIYAAFLAFELIFRSAPAYSRPKYWTHWSFLMVLRTLVAPLTLMFLWKIYPLSFDPFWWRVSPFITYPAAILAYSFVHYWNHRLRHQSQFVWRVFHQLHHSPKKFDLSSNFWVHPIDVAYAIAMVYFTVAVLKLGASHLAFLLVAKNLLNKGQHLNVPTPYWLGYIVHRPEQHRLHHCNYRFNLGLLPIWDMIFGTFKNCREEVTEIGFSEAAQSRFWDAFLFRKISD